MTRQRRVELDPAVARRAPLVTETMPFVAHPQIRCRGTLGGIFAHADPAAELPAVAIALDAHFTLASARVKRVVGSADFFTGLFSTLIEPDELLTEVFFPAMPPRVGWSFQEVSRRHGDFALAGAAAVVVLDDQGACRTVRLVFLGLGSRPIESKAAQHLNGAAPDSAAISEVAAAVDEEIDPSGDIHASAEFRRHLARVLTRRVLETAAARASKRAEPDSPDAAHGQGL
jgi:CO/xanthine dehydrogenase FAD-binding subunit